MIYRQIEYPKKVQHAIVVLHLFTFKLTPLFYEKILATSLNVKKIMNANRNK